MPQPEELSSRIDRLHAPGLVDMHFDLLMELYDKRDRADVLRSDFLPSLKAGGIGVLAAAIYLEDRYLPEMGLRVALDQVAKLYEQVKAGDFSICTSFEQIEAARRAGRIALIITMEGVEPLGNDLRLLTIFHRLGLRALGLTHARRNAAGEGGIFAPAGSSPQGLTAFGREVVQACEELGIIVDLAHINPAGFDDVLSLATKPVVVSHTNTRRYYDVERNISDSQIKAIGERRGVIGLNAVLVSPTQEGSTLDRFIDHVEHVAGIAGWESVGLGFDFFESVYNQWSEEERRAFNSHYASVHFVPDLTNHSHTRNLTRRLIERGYPDERIEKIFYRNWMRLFQEML